MTRDQVVTGSKEVHQIAPRHRIAGHAGGVERRCTPEKDALQKTVNVTSANAQDIGARSAGVAKKKGLYKR